MESQEKGHEYKTGITVRVITRLMLPFILMFGLSIVVHGHLTPGGGFQGGVVIGTALVLLTLVFNKEEGRHAAPEAATKSLLASGIFIYMFTGLVGIFAGYAYLANKCIEFPPTGELGELFSGGTLFWITIGVGLVVSGIVIELFYAFIEEKRESVYYKKVKILEKERRWSDEHSQDSLK
jgi:multicomponent Na+:H+ antiporter subunit B